MQKWDHFAAAATQLEPLTKVGREKVAQKRHLVHTRRGDHNTTKSTTKTAYSVASRLTPESTESPKSPDAHSREGSRARTLSQNSKWPFSQLINTITNLAINKLGLVAELVELTFPSRNTEVPDGLHSQERRRSGRRVEL